MLEIPTRRGLITGLGALFLAAPAIVRASSLMPINARHLAPSVIAADWALAWKYIVSHDENGLADLILKRIPVSWREAARSGEDG